MNGTATQQNISFRSGQPQWPIAEAHQAAAIKSLAESLRGGSRSPVLTIPTGGGKTIIAALICQMARAKGNRVLFLAPRRELVHQTVRTFERAGLETGMVMAGEEMVSAPIMVGSFDTLHARAVRTSRMALPDVDLVMPDEAHLTISKSRLEILRRYLAAGTRLIGLTATPCRGDGRGLGELYDDLISPTTVRELIDSGRLVEPVYYAGKPPDLAGVKIQGGDYQVKSLSAAVDTSVLVGDIVTNWLRIARDRRTVVFCVDRRHSIHLCEQFVKAGIRAEHVDALTPDDQRKAIFDRVRSGQTTVLCNVFIASYGLDIPELDCAVLARPTRSLALYIQVCGRVLRSLAGKRDAIILDHAGAVANHGFLDDPIPWTLDAEMKVADKRKLELEAKNQPKDITCRQCGYVFRSRRDCPKCGAVMIPTGRAIPVHEADLEKITKEKRKLNKDMTTPEKRDFYSELLGYAMKHRFKRGWAANQYRERFAVWPNTHGKNVKPTEPGTDTNNWIKSRLIAWRKSNG